MSDELQAVVAAIEAGDIGRARFLLRPLLANPSADILFVASKVAPNKDEAKKRLLEALALDPLHEGVKAELAKVEVAQSKVYLPGGITVEEKRMSAFNAPDLPGFPKLPPLPKAVVAHTYLPSGKVSPLYFVLLVLLGVPAAIIVGYAAHWVGMVLVVPVILLLEGWLGEVSQVETYRIGRQLQVLLFLFAAIVIVLLLFPAVFGLILGVLLWQIAKWGRCRNLRAAVWGTLLTSAFGAGVFVYFSMQSGGLLASLFMGSSVPVGLYAAMIAGILVFVGVNVLVVRRYVATTPFSEKTGTWYRANWLNVRISPNDAPALLEAVMNGSSVGLQKAGRMPASQYPYLDVRLRSHPNSQFEDFHLKVTVFWKEVMQGPKGPQASVEQEVWFDVMIPPGVGDQIEKALFRIDQLI